jgi:cytochrome c oxidase cbb3-type subunit 3
MSSQTRDQLTDHEYDGIREYDNPTPGWWTLVYVGTIVFSIVYFMYYTFNYSASSLHENYDAAVAANLEKQFGAIGTLTPDEPTLIKYSHDPEWLEVGQQVFKGNCVSCHGADGQGLVGPNLTDDRYKRVETIADIAQIVTNGAANGAMPAWNNRLQTNEIVLVSAYVASLRGRNLAGLTMEGEKEIPPWPTAPAADAPAAEPASGDL